MFDEEFAFAGRRGSGIHFNFGFGGPHGGHHFDPHEEFGHGPEHEHKHGPQSGHGFFSGFMMRKQFPFGPGGRGPRMFGRGDVKFALLEMLQERPKYGYELMKELEQKASGFYTPSAGAIYPTLQMMEERGWVTSTVVDSKKVYTITDAGKAALQENSQREEPSGRPFGGPPWGHHHGPWGHNARPDLEGLRHESGEVARMMWGAVMASEGDPHKLQQLRAIVARTRQELEQFLTGNTETGPQDSPPPTAGEKIQ